MTTISRYEPSLLDQVVDEVKGWYWGFWRGKSAGPGSAAKWYKRSEDLKEGVLSTVRESVLLIPKAVDDIEWAAGINDKKYFDDYSLPIQLGLERGKKGASTGELFFGLTTDIAKVGVKTMTPVGRAYSAAEAVYDVVEGVAADDWKQVGEAAPGLILLPEAVGNVGKWSGSASRLWQSHPSLNTAPALAIEGAGIAPGVIEFPQESWQSRISPEQGPRRFGRGDRADAWKGSGGECEYCGKRMIRSPGQPNSMELDHFVPYSQGGPTNAGNRVASCLNCNRRKGDLDPFNWLMKLWGLDK